MRTHTSRFRTHSRPYATTITCAELHVYTNFAGSFDLYTQHRVLELIRPRPKQTPLQLPLLDEKGKGNIGSITVLSAVTDGPINYPPSLLSGESLLRLAICVCVDRVRVYTFAPAHARARWERSMQVNMPPQTCAYTGWPTALSWLLPLSLT